MGDCLAPNASADCEVSIDDPGDPGSLPEGAQECDLTALRDPPSGICVEVVDAGWDMTLARMAYLPKSQLRCPDSAPYPGLLGVEIRDDGLPPRNVVACSVLPFPSCHSAGLACVPFEPDYPACTIQSGAHTCRGKYQVRTAVEEDGLGGEVTVCCEPPDQRPL